MAWFKHSAEDRSEICLAMVSNSTLSAQNHCYSIFYYDYCYCYLHPHNHNLFMGLSLVSEEPRKWHRCQVNRWAHRSTVLTQIAVVAGGRKDCLRELCRGSSPGTHHPDSIPGLALYTTASVFSGEKTSCGEDELKQSVQSHSVGLT